MWRRLGSLVVVLAVAVGLAGLAPVALSAPVLPPLIVIGPRIAASYYSSLMIAADGVPYGTGANEHGELTGTGGRSVFTKMSGLPTGVKATAVSAGYDHSLVLGSNGVAYGTGAGADGQLTGSEGRPALTPMSGLPDGVKAVAVAAGHRFSEVLGSDGKAYGTGLGGSGQLTGTSLVRTLTPMTGLPAGLSATAVAVGQHHSLVLTSDGRVYGTGSGESGAITGTTDRTTLTELSGLPTGVKATAIAAGDSHSLVLASSGLVYGTGFNGGHQLTGDEPTWTSLAPLEGLWPGTIATTIAGGAGHSLVVAVGAVYGAGTNYHGQLTGAGTAKLLTPLVGLPAGVSAVQVAGGNGHTLVLGSDGVIYGTGRRSFGELTGSGSNITTLTALPGQPLVNQVSLRPPVRVGTPVTLHEAGWTPTAASTYQWRANGVAIAGATKSSYLPPPSLLGKWLSVTVTGSRPGVNPVPLTSTPVVVALGVAPTWTAKSRPFIKGRAKVGRKLTLVRATGKGFTPAAGTLTYRWLRNGKPIKKATKARYKVKKADRGKKLSVRVTAIRTGHLNGTHTTKAVTIAKKKT